MGNPVLKDYKLKEALSNMRQALDNVNKNVAELSVNVWTLADILTEREKDQTATTEPEAKE